MQPVSGEIHIHPVPRLVLQVSDRCGLDEVGLDDPVELAALVPVREFLDVHFIETLLRHSFPPQKPDVFRHPLDELVVTVRLDLVVGSVFLKEAQEIVFIHREDLLNGLPALVERVDVLLHGVP